MNVSSRIALFATGLVLVAALSCQRGLRDPKAQMKEQLLAEFADRSPRVGESAPNFTARDLDGNPRMLSEFLARGPLVLDFANYT